MSMRNCCHALKQGRLCVLVLVKHSKSKLYCMYSLGRVHAVVDAFGYSPLGNHTAHVPEETMAIGAPRFPTGLHEELQGRGTGYPGMANSRTPGGGTRC